jgi:hypothetical protein
VSDRAYNVYMTRTAATATMQKFVSAVSINVGTLAATDPEVSQAAAEAALQADGITDRGEGFPFRFGVWVAI